jgi:hypothetical protein
MFPLEGRSLSIFVVTLVFLILSFISVALRCFVRLRLVRAFGWDDSLMVLAMALNILFALCGMIGARWGLGRRMVDFAHSPDPEHELETALFVCVYLLINGYPVWPTDALLTPRTVVVARPDKLCDHMRGCQNIHRFGTPPPYSH